MSRPVRVICILLALQPGVGRAQSDEDELVRDYAKTVADAYKSNPKALALIKKATAK